MAEVYTSTGLDNPLVALSNILKPGVSSTTISSGVDCVFNMGMDAAIIDKDTFVSYIFRMLIEDLIVLAFHTRDPRGGMGQRDISRYMFEALLNIPGTSAITMNLLRLIPEYGCWQDLFKLPPIASTRVNKIIKDQFDKDLENLIAYNAAQENEVNGWGGEEPLKKPTLSLLAKWLPREGQPHATEMATLLVPGKMFSGTRMKYYRKKVSLLNKALNTVEINMCSKNWSGIHPNTVPKGALKKYKKAFLNEKGTIIRGVHVPDDGRMRYPNNADRMICRNNFIKHFSDSSNIITPDEDTNISPGDALRKKLDNKRYDLVRNSIRQFYYMEDHKRL